LEDLEPGTTVFVGETQVGEIRGVYAIGDSQLAEYVCVAWGGNTELLVPTSEVLDIESRGVVLAGPLDSYNDLRTFDSKGDPKIRRLH
jgi:hypothetical protein